MKKKIINAVLAGCLLSVPFNTPMQAAEEYDLVIYAINTETEEFDRWLSAAEQACDIRIGVVPAPTDSDTRQQKFKTVLSTGDSSIDILIANDEMVEEINAHCLACFLHVDCEPVIILAWHGIV